MKAFWFIVFLLTLAVPAALVTYGYRFDRHTSSTVGGPLTIGLMYVLSAVFDGLLWIGIVLVLAVRSWRSPGTAEKSGT